MGSLSGVLMAEFWGSVPVSLLQTDPYWLEIKELLEKMRIGNRLFLAPNEFIQHFPGCSYYNAEPFIDPDLYDVVVYHKGDWPRFSVDALKRLEQSYSAIFENPIFIVLLKNQAEFRPSFQTYAWAKKLIYSTNARQQLRAHRTEREKINGSDSGPRVACFITTFDRPKSLSRTLPQIVELGVPVLVVDDGSSAKNWKINQATADACGVPIIRAPENRGVSWAINVGVSYHLANPDIEWISYFQDDVDVHPSIMDILAQVQDPETAPLLSGRNDEQHPTKGKEKRGDLDILLKASIPAVHMHAHRDYWTGILPVPTVYAGAPHRQSPIPGQGADEDFWIGSWAPNSVLKKGRHIVVVPGLVRTFYLDGEGSTWTDYSVKDPPLREDLYSPEAENSTRAIS